MCYITRLSGLANRISYFPVGKPLRTVLPLKIAVVGRPHCLKIAPTRGWVRQGARPEKLNVHVRKADVGPAVGILVGPALPFATMAGPVNLGRNDPVRPGGGIVDRQVPHETLPRIVPDRRRRRVAVLRRPQRAAGCPGSQGVVGGELLG